MKLSIITATYNCDDLFDACLKSVANQDIIDDIEHIIVDGGSTNNTLATAASYPHVKKIYSSPDRGIYHAFNRGVEMAEGDVVYFLGADDTLNGTSNLAKVLVEFSNRDIDYVSTRVRCFDDNTGETWLTHASEKEGTNVCHQGFFCRKSLFEKIGPFSECFTLYADSFFMKTAMRRYSGKYLDIVSANFRQGGSSSLSSNRTLLKKESQAVALLLEDGVKDNQHQLDRNVQDLKFLLEQLVCKEHAFGDYQGKNIAVFGTRQLSIIIANALKSAGGNIQCFVTSDRQATSSIKDVPIKSLDMLSQLPLDIIVNCVEGAHEEAIAESIRRSITNAEVVSWRAL